MICFLFTFACQVDGTIPLALPGVSVLDLGFSRYLPRMLMGDGDAPGDSNAGTRCAEGDAQGQEREEEEVALSQRQESRSTAGTYNINKSFNEKYICCWVALWPETQTCFLVQRWLLQDLLFYNS